jgi:glycosyltransferase involved in cell wall biosynthesis
MHVLIVADSYFPSPTSVAVLLHELAQTFIEEQVEVSIVVPNAIQIESLIYWSQDGCHIISVKALQTKDVNYAIRTFSEFVNPWIIWQILKRSEKFTKLSIDGIIWYSPSIFWGPLIKRLKKHFQCRSYLILRDIFPDWALHLGVLNKGPAYMFFKAVEYFQYRQANTIGIQSPNNLIYFQKNYPTIRAKLEVLWNWIRPLDMISKKKCSIDISQTCIAGRIIFVYAGNLGVAQGLGTLLQLIKNVNQNKEIGFLIVGRGSESDHIRNYLKHNQIENTVISNEIESAEIPSLLGHCHVGLLFLDNRHQTHNIPGKFMTYLQSGLPVLGVVNSGNDLISFIKEHDIGDVYTGNDIEILAQKAINLTRKIRDGELFHDRCKNIASSYFNSTLITSQIIKALRLQCEC